MKKFAVMMLTAVFVFIGLADALAYLVNIGFKITAHIPARFYMILVQGRLLEQCPFRIGVCALLSPGKGVLKLHAHILPTHWQADLV